MEWDWPSFIDLVLKEGFYPKLLCLLESASEEDTKVAATVLLDHIAANASHTEVCIMAERKDWVELGTKLVAQYQGRKHCEIYCKLVGGLERIVTCLK